MILGRKGRTGKDATGNRQRPISHVSDPESNETRSGRFFRQELGRLVSSQVLPSSRVLDISCGTGELLEACRPELGWGVDGSCERLDIARARYPHLVFFPAIHTAMQSETLSGVDYVVAALALDRVPDVHSTLESVRTLMSRNSRIVIVTYNRLWRPAIRVAEILGLKKRHVGENYVPWDQIENLLALSGFEVTKHHDGVLVPVRVPVISRFVNRWVAPLPVFRALCMLRVTVARPKVQTHISPSVSVVVAARNESGHIEELVRRLPLLARDQELIFVEGGSTDDTWLTIQQVIAEQDASDMPIRAFRQSGVGKGDAIRLGFSEAQKEILMILDADLSVPPEELRRFMDALTQDHCEFANGSRLVYPMEDGAMRFLNLVGNKVFGTLFTFLLGQPVRDTLCGTKVLYRETYRRMACQRRDISELDPFGDFDLLFGASKMGLKIRDIPVHYKQRTYGTTNISRFSHGWLLIRMSWVAARRVKFVG